MNSNPTLFEIQSSNYLKANASRIFPEHMLGQPGVCVIRRTADAQKVEMMWLNQKDLALAFEQGEGHTLQHHIGGLMAAVARTDFSREICMGVLSDDSETLAVCMLNPLSISPRRKAKRLSRRPLGFSPDGPSAA